MRLPPPQEFCQAWGQFSEVPGCLLSIHSTPIKSLSLLIFVISVSTVPLKSGVKLLTCSNGEQCCPLAACSGSICTLPYWWNLIIFKCEFLLGSGILT